MRNWKNIYMLGIVFLITMYVVVKKPISQKAKALLQQQLHQITLSR